MMAILGADGKVGAVSLLMVISCYGMLNGLDVNAVRKG
jgi:hypothetical protein